jgi:hypothetical protein
MGAYKYLEEIWRKKQSDVLRFLLRVRYQNKIRIFYSINIFHHKLITILELGNIAKGKRYRKLAALRELIKLISWDTKQSR